MSYPVSETNILYSGAQYHNSETPIWASALTGLSTVGPNISVSSIILPPQGAMFLENTPPNSASIIYDRPVGDLLNTPSLITMSSNAVAGGNVANISIVNDTKTFYDNLALGDLLVYGNNSITNPSGLVGSIGQYASQTALSLNSPAVYTSSIWISTINGQPYGSAALGPDIIVSTITIGEVAFIEQFGATTDLEVSTTGFHTQNIITSSINGYEFPGQAAVPTNIQVSTIEVNPFGLVRLNASGTSTSIVTAGLFFQYTPDLLAINNPAIKMTFNNTAGALGVSRIENITITKVNPVDGIHYDVLALGELLVYGTSNPKSSGFGQVASLRQWSTSTDLEVVTTGLHTSSITASNIEVRTAFISSLFVSSIVDYAFLVSTATITELVASNISSLTGKIPLFNASTLAFNPSLGGVNLGGIDLGLGGYLGGLTGQLVSGALTTTIAGAALGTGLAGLVLGRTTNNYTNNSESTFQLINTQTQLQFSTLLTPTSTFTRFVSSIDGGVFTPGQEYIVSSIIPANSLCIRSFSDPLNPANASTAFSTIQSFGAWVAVPLPTISTSSTIIGNLNVTSTLTAYNISTNNISTQAIQTNDISTNTLKVSSVLGVSLSTSQTINTSTLTSRSANISTLTVSSINGVVYPPLSLAPSSINVSSISTYFIQTTIGSVSSFTVSSINGFQFTPGGGGNATGVFSTLFVSSVAIISSITASSINASVINVTAISSLQARIGSVSISSAIVRASDMIASSFLGNLVLITNPPNPGFSLLDYTTIQTSLGTFSSILTSNLISTKAINVSSINGQIYPPAFNSTIIGNFNVTSTLTAYDLNGVNISATDGVFAQDYITTNGFITCSNLTGTTNITSLGNIVATTSITGANANIGGVTIGPAAGLVATQINCSNATVSTINGAAYPPLSFPSTVLGNFNVLQTLTANRINCSTSIYANTNQFQGVFGGFLQATAGINGANITASGYLSGTILQIANTASIPSITGLNFINGLPYPPAASALSTFNQLFTSSIVASNVTTIGTNTGFISSLQARIGGVSISSTTVNASDMIASSFLGNVVLITNPPTPGFSLLDYQRIQTSDGNFSTITSSNSISTKALYVSSINNSAYPPPAIALVSTFSTITVSSLVSGNISSGTIIASGGVIGAVSLLGGTVTAALVAGTQVNANSITVQTNAVGNSIVALTGISYFSTMVVNGAIGAGADNVVNFQNGAIAGTSNVGYELNIVSSCRIGGNLSTIGNLIVGGGIILNTLSTTGNAYIGGNLNVNQVINTPQSINVSTGNLGYVDIESSGIFVGNSNNTLTGQLSPNLIKCFNTTTNEQTRMLNTGLDVFGVNSVAFTRIQPNFIQMVADLDIAINRTTILNGTITTDAVVATVMNPINPNVNNGAEYTMGNQLNTTILTGVPIAGYGQAAMTFTKIQSGSYGWGPLFNFTNGQNYVVPNLQLAGGYPTYLTFAVQSRGNVNGNFAQIYGVWNVYVGFGDGVAGLLPDIYIQNTIFAHNVSIVFTINSLNQTVLINVVSNVGGPNYVTDVRCSWTVQPLFAY